MPGRGLGRLAAHEAGHLVAAGDQPVVLRPENPEFAVMGDDSVAAEVVGLLGLPDRDLMELALGAVEQLHVPVAGAPVPESGGQHVVVLDALDLDVEGLFDGAGLGARPVDAVGRDVLVADGLGTAVVEDDVGIDGAVFDDDHLEGAVRAGVLVVVAAGAGQVPVVLAGGDPGQPLEAPSLILADGQAAGVVGVEAEADVVPGDVVVADPEPGEARFGQRGRVGEHSSS